MDIKQALSINVKANHLYNAVENSLFDQCIRKWGIRYEGLSEYTVISDTHYSFKNLWTKFAFSSLRKSAAWCPSYWASPWSAWSSACATAAVADVASREGYFETFLPQPLMLQFREHSPLWERNLYSWSVSSLTRLNLTNKENMLLFVCCEAVEQYNCVQSYKHFMIINYDSRGIPD